MEEYSAEAYLINTQAEQHVLGSILYEPELINDCTLSPHHFYEERHQNLFHVLRDLHQKEKPINAVSIVERVGSNKLEKIGGIGYISDLGASVPSTADFNYYQGVVYSYFEKRQTHDIARGIMQSVVDQESEPAEIRANAIQAFNALDDLNADDDDGSIKPGIVKLYDWMEQDHGNITGAPTGFTELDRMTSGLQKQDLIIVGARPSMGKTAFALNIALNIADHNGPVGIFSLEMPEQGLLKRMMSNVGNIDAQRMRNPLANFQGEDWQKSTMAMGRLHGMPLHIFDKSGADLHYIRKKCRLLKRKYPKEHIVIMIDYLQLIVGDPKHKGNRMAEISEISRLLKQLARELDITVIALSQLSRGVEQRQDKRPMMSDLRESGQIEQDADVIGFLYRDDYYNKETEAKNIIEIIIAKQRNGPVGTIELAFVKEYNKFVSLERKHG